MRSSLQSRSVVLPFVLAPVVAFLLVWVPEFRFYSVPEAKISEEMLDSARALPADSVLAELRVFYLYPYEHRRPEITIAIAEGILKGRLEMPDLPPGRITLPFSDNDLVEIAPALRLWFAGYVVPDFLLAAFAETHREEFFTAARDFIVAWNAFERRTWLTKGLLWNDHATANRVRVLGEFWRLYRHRPDFDPVVGRAVLQQAARYRQFLSSAGHFTFATNHGVMQNAALLHLELAFPSLGDGERYERLALERLGKQFGFFMDHEGVIRENSAGYQAFGLEMLGITFRCMTLLGAPVPAEWKQRYERGLAFLARLERPDGTLPSYGDTDGASQSWLPRVTEIDAQGRSGALHPRAQAKPDRELSLHPAAGYWIDWDGLENWPGARGVRQTVVTWTRPPAPGHKHADEMSVLLWSDGISWLTNVGYWPYELADRNEAESWEAGNAPHIFGEPLESSRTARLLSSGRTARLAALDLKRSGPGNYVARRQVVHLRPDLWVIVDHVQGDSTRKNRTVWTLSPDVRAQARDSAGSFALEPTGNGAAARLTFLGSDGTTTREYRGSHAPFAGWQVIRAVPQPASAIVVEQPAGDAWLAVVFSKADPSAPATIAMRKPQMSPANTADQWGITLPIQTGDLQITRTAGKLVVVRSELRGASTDTLELTPAPDPTQELASIRTAFDTLAREYPAFQDLASSRVKVTYLLLALVVGQELFFLIIRRRVPKYHVPLRVTSLACWVGVAVWLHFSFLRSWEVIAG